MKKFLPQLTQQQIRNMQHNGFANSQTQSAKLPKWCIPRTTQYDIFTLSMMGLAAAGVFVGKKYKLVYFPFTIAFVAAPTLALIQTKQMDSFSLSHKSRRPFKAQLQTSKQSKKAFQTVMNQADDYIQQLKVKRDELRAQLNKKKYAVE